MIQKDGKKYYTLEEVNTYLDASIEKHADEMVVRLANKKKEKVYA